VRTVIGAVHDDCVVLDSQFFELVENRTDILVVIDHGIVILTLPASGLPQTFRFDMGAKMHVGKVHPDKERLTGLVLFFDELRGPCRKIIIYGFHAFSGQGPGILDFLCAIRLGEAVDNTARAEFFQKLRVGRVVAMLRLL